MDFIVRPVLHGPDRWGSFSDDIPAGWVSASWSSLAESAWTVEPSAYELLGSGSSSSYALEVSELGARWLDELNLTGCRFLMSCLLRRINLLLSVTIQYVSGCSSAESMYPGFHSGELSSVNQTGCCEVYFTIVLCGLRCAARLSESPWLTHVGSWTRSSNNLLPTD